MINYRKILELYDQGISLRGIAASTGNSRQKVTKAIELAKEKGLVCPLDEEMTDKWIEDFLFPEKSLEGSRFSAFEEEEKFALSPLPATAYKMSEW